MNFQQVIKKIPEDSKEEVIEEGLVKEAVIEKLMMEEEMIENLEEEVTEDLEEGVTEDLEEGVTEDLEEGVTEDLEEETWCKSIQGKYPINNEFRARNSGSNSESSPNMMEHQMTEEIPLWKFFLQGDCRFGDKCMFEHPSTSRSQKLIGGHKVWTKPQHKPLKKTISDDMSEDKLEGEDGNGEEVELFSQEEKHNANKGKDLRSILMKNRLKKPVNLTPSNSSSNESDNAYNSDTFGNIKTHHIGKKKNISSSKPVPQSNKINDFKDDALSDIDSLGEDAEEEKIQPTIISNTPQTQIIQTSPIKAFEQIQTIILKANKDKLIGKSPELATNKAQMIWMCQEDEILKRQNWRELFVFELDPINNDLSVVSKESPPNAKPEWCIKNYKRSAADIQLDDPQTIRPIPLQWLILDYMLEEIADSDRNNIKFYKGKKIHFDEINAFFFDRTRAMRQELTLIGQNTCKGHIQLLEKIARFHCLASNEALGGEDFSAKQNNEQFTSSLTMLRESYDQVHSILDDPNNKFGPSYEVYQSPFEGELRAYMILTSMNNTLEVLETLRSLTPQIMKWKEVKLATQIYHAYKNRETEKFFKLFRKAPYLMACCCVHTIDMMRMKSMLNFQSSIKEVTDHPETGKKSIMFRMNLDMITDLLCLNNSKEAKAYLKTIGWTTIKNPENGNIEIIKGGEADEIWKPVTNVKYIESK